MKIMSENTIWVLVHDTIVVNFHFSFKQILMSNLKNNCYYVTAICNNNKNICKILSQSQYMIFY